jgi:16S rRNA (cytosine1402-N4)-methyltransferase
MESIHRTVLLNETIEGLNLSPSSLVLDCTFGGGGHSAEICKKYPGVKIIALDQDKSAFEKAKSKFKNLKCDISFANINFKDLDKENLDCDITFVNTNFKDLDKTELKEVDGIVFDLGLSSDQLENSGRGFSFLRDEPLLMTMKENPKEEDLTASDIVNNWSEENLAKIIYGYGEEKLSRRIAKAIVDTRQKTEIKTTFDLVKILEGAIGRAYKRQKLHFATRTFQALRIAVNDELGVLQMGLQKGFEILNIGGRMAVISFHSLEDRIVKRFYQNKVKEGKAILINKKPMLATDEELKTNPRARSAKLRVLEKIT